MTQKTHKQQLDSTARASLLNEAVTAAENAYAPYSKFRVGAAVLGLTGAIYRGANIENASYGLGTCAERVALAMAYSSGEREIAAIAIACVDAPEQSELSLRAPCGACRQWIQELAPSAEILIFGEDQPFNIKDFLPLPFALNLQGKK